MSADFTRTITVDATPQQAFDAINDVTGWWGRITGRTTSVGDEWVYVVPGLHYSGMRVTELEPGRRVAWLVTGSYLDFVEDHQEWNDTTVTFDIAETDSGTQVTFTHAGLEPRVECYKVCSDAWSMFIAGSLKDFINTGVGKPYVFSGAEALSADDHQELHDEVQASAAME
ncbi:SRPBCC family protein [Demequina sp.]|uniref:SRPBCC family protein n=1 Tax=Demequina sp. TaxID=2050685 RepID=UPI003D0F9102